MALDAVRPVDHQDRIVQHLQRPFHLCREIHMARRIQESHRRISQCKLCLFGKDRDPPGPFQLICIQKSVLIIHSPQLPYGPGGI